MTLIVHLSIRVSRSEDWARRVLGAGASGFPDSWSENDPVCLTQESSLLSGTHIRPVASSQHWHDLNNWKAMQGLQNQDIYPLSTIAIGEVSSALPQHEKKAERALVCGCRPVIDKNQGRGLPFGVPSSGLFVLLWPVLLWFCFDTLVCGIKSQAKEEWKWDFPTDL